MNHIKKVDMSVADGVQAQGIQVIGMKRETLYQIAAYAPVAVDKVGEILKQLAPNIWRKKLIALKAKVIERDGIQSLSISDILESFRKIPQGLADALMVNPIWVDEFHNLVTTAGLNDSLTQHFKGSSYTAAWYVGLTAGTPTFNAADIMSSHSGWTENVTYSESVRQTLTLGSVASGSVDNSASKAVFSINGTTTVGGAFLTTVSTKSGTTGTLYGGGAFGGGNRSLQSGDTLSITITLTAS